MWWGGIKSQRPATDRTNARRGPRAPLTLPHAMCVQKKTSPLQKKRDALTLPAPTRTAPLAHRHATTAPPEISVGQVRARSERAPWPPRIHSVSGRLDAAPPRRDTSTHGSAACGCPSGVPPASPPPGGGPSAPLPPPRRSAVGFGMTAMCRKPKSGVGQPVAQPCDSAATATHSCIPPSISTAPSRPPPAPPHPP